MASSAAADPLVLSALREAAVHDGIRKLESIMDVRVLADFRDSRTSPSHPGRPATGLNKIIANTAFAAEIVDAASLSWYRRMKAAPPRHMPHPPANSSIRPRMGAAIHHLLAELIVDDGQNSEAVQRCTLAAKSLEADYLDDQHDRARTRELLTFAAALPRMAGVIPQIHYLLNKEYSTAEPAAAAAAPAHQTRAQKKKQNKQLKKQQAKRSARQETEAAMVAVTEAAHAVLAATGHGAAAGVATAGD